MRAWTIRFRGGDERETLARADAFFLLNKEAIGLTREEFFARLVMSEDGGEAQFVSPDDPLWNQQLQTGTYGERIDPVGTEPAVGFGPRDAEEPGPGLERPEEPPEPAQPDDAL